jgi:hypothetical protein
MGVKRWRARTLDRTEWATVVTVERDRLKGVEEEEEEEEEEGRGRKRL